MWTCTPGSWLRGTPRRWPAGLPVHLALSVQANARPVRINACRDTQVEPELPSFFGAVSDSQSPLTNCSVHLSSFRSIAMAAYRRKTDLKPSAAFTLAVDILQNVFKFSRTTRSRKEVTLVGGEGEVSLTAHRHGHYTLITAITDQLRTSRLDYEVQRILSWMPYEPGDRRGPTSGDLGATSARGSGKMWTPGDPAFTDRP